LLRPGGHYALIGMVHPNTALELTGEAIVRRCLTIRGYHNYAPRHLEQAVKFLREHRDAHPWKRLVSPSFPLKRLDEAFAAARSQRWARVSVQPQSN